MRKYFSFEWIRNATTTIAAATFLAGTFIVSLAQASPLGDLAAAMVPGEWAELATDGFANGNILVPGGPGCTTGDYITQFADSAAWDKIGRRVLFIGQAHGTCYGGRFITYSDLNNAWTTLPYPPVCQGIVDGAPCFAHAYDHNTVDPATGDLYYRHYGSSFVHRYTAVNPRWETLPEVPEDVVRLRTCCNAMEYFPEMGGLIVSGGLGQVGFYNPQSDQWSSLASGLPFGDIHNIIEYNPVHKVILFGGGNGGNVLFRLDADGTITQMAPTPIGLGITQTVISVDPVSGDYLVFTDAGLYEYDIVADRWTASSTSIPFNNPGDGVIEAAIGTYGVIMVVRYDFSNSKVYLYKHSPSDPTRQDPTTPEPPTELRIATGD